MFFVFVIGHYSTCVIWLPDDMMCKRLLVVYRFVSVCDCEMVNRNVVCMRLHLACY